MIQYIEYLLLFSQVAVHYLFFFKCNRSNGLSIFNCQIAYIYIAHGNPDIINRNTQKKGHPKPRHPFFTTIFTSQIKPNQNGPGL